MLSSDHITGATGKTPTVTISKNGGAYATPVGAVSEVGNGFYKVAASAADSSTLGPLLLHATASGCDPTDEEFIVVNYNPTAFTPTVGRPVAALPTQTTFRQLGTRAFYNIGVATRGFTMDATSLEDARVRCNNMLAGWQTQSLTVLAVERQLFNLVPNQQSYTLGIGGDFNLPRPVHGLQGAGLLLNGLNAAQTLSSILLVGNTATATSALPHGLSEGDEIVISGATQYPYNGTILVKTVPSTVTFTYNITGSPSSPADGSPVFQTFSGTPPVEIPRAVITDDGFQALSIKRLSSQLFTEVYYNPTYPMGTIFLWPNPPTNANQLVLYLENVFTGFADLSTGYDYPNVPGYAEAIEYNLSVRLCEPYGRPIPPMVAQLAKDTLGLIKRANYKLSDLPTDPMFTKTRRGGYNILDGTGGGN